MNHGHSACIYLAISTALAAASSSPSGSSANGKSWSGFLTEGIDLQPRFPNHSAL